MDKKTADDRIADFEAKLEEYEEKCSIPTEFKGGSEEIDKYLTMGRDELEKLSAEDCWQTAIILAQFSFYLQRKSNIEQSRLNYIMGEINRVCSELYTNYDQYAKFDVKINLIAKENAYVGRLLQLKTHVQGRLDRLSFLASSVKHIGDLFNRNVKKKYEREFN